MRRRFDSPAAMAKHGPSSLIVSILVFVGRLQLGNRLLAGRRQGVAVALLLDELGQSSNKAVVAKLAL